LSRSGSWGSLSRRSAPSVLEHIASSGALRTSSWLFPQDLLHRLALRQLIDELVEVTDLPHQWFLDLFHTDATDDAFDERSIGVQRGRLVEKMSKRLLVIDLAPEI
jgi:hypothetical protein